MGCTLSALKNEDSNKKEAGQEDAVVVFVPGFRIPKCINSGRSLNDCSSASMAGRLSALRMRLVATTAGKIHSAVKAKKKAATQQAESTLADLQQALEDYLPVVLVLTKDGSQLNDLVEYIWINREDNKQETKLPCTWYEVLSVLHMMAMVYLSQANLLLISKAPTDDCQLKVIEDNKKAAISKFLKAAGFLDCGVQHVLPQIPQEVKMKLPADLKEGVLQAFSAQALGQGVEIQLGMAINNPKATLAVKRRIACEQVKCWFQAQESMSNVCVGSGWGEKHLIFIKWKYVEAKAAAYHFHGLILDEANEENNYAKAVACLQAAEQYLKHKISVRSLQ